MDPTYVAITLLTVAANAFSAGCDFVRYRQVAVGMAAVGVPESWMTMLGVLKAAGALGLLAGFALPPVGAAAAAGLVLFFLAAIGAHLRARDASPSLGLAVVFLLLAVASLVLVLAR